MKREHLVCLLGECQSGCLGPPFQPVPMDVWQELVERKIISELEKPASVSPADPEDEYEGQSYGCYCSMHNGYWRITGFSSEELQKLHEEGQINIYSIEDDLLALYTARHWGISPAYLELDTGFYSGDYILGWKDHETAVVITDFGNMDGSISGFLDALKDNINDKIQDMKEDGFLNELKDDEPELFEQSDILSCKNLYVVNAGSSYPRTSITEKVLRDDGIRCLGTDDFLTDEGLPKWDAQVSARPFLTFSDANKEFYCDGKPLELKPTEMKIFMLLRENGDKITTHEELFQVIWPRGRKSKRRPGAKLAGKPDWPEGPLFAHISALRKRLKEISKIEIKTIRGKGYKLIMNQ